MDSKQNKLAVVIIAFFMCLSSITIAQNLTSEMDTVSYSLGVVFAKQMQQKGIKDLNHDVVSKAIKDILTGEELAIDGKECEAIMKNHLKIIKREMMLNAKEDGIIYLAANAKRKEVTVTESGLQYEVMVKGDGKMHPELTDKVNVHYHGMLIDGRVFDSSVDRGAPISFPLNGVIQGWQEGVQLMVVGDKFKFHIPSELAYGGQAAGALIGPHSTLVFEVELLGIN